MDSETGTRSAPGFWGTLPGMITAIATLITALVAAGFLVAGNGDGDKDGGNGDDRTPPPPGIELNTPELLSPDEEAEFSVYPRITTLRWSEVAGAEQYLVEVEYLSGGSYSPLVSETVTDPEFTFDFVGAQPGRWRVTARADDMDDSGPSVWRSFTYTV